MKRVSYALVMALALVAMLSTAALADCGSCGGEKAHAEKADAKMGECCVKAAQAGKGCCGKSAEEVKVAYASCKATCAATCSATEKAKCASTCSAADKTACSASEAAMSEMHKCCAKAVKAGKGCCGKDANALKASYDEKVTFHVAAATAMADMDKCCAKALDEGKGCCGKSAEALEASYDEKVKKAAKEMKAKEKASL